MLVDFKSRASCEPPLPQIVYSYSLYFREFLAPEVK